MVSRLLAAVLLLCACSAGAVQWQDSPRVLVALALLAAMAATVLLLGLRRLARAPSPPVIDPPFGPAASPAELLRLEALLDHAPVALWKLDADGAQALNVAARRLLAPGAAVSAAPLLEQLREASAAQRQLIGFESERGHERAVLASTPLQLAGAAPARLVALMPIESELETEALGAWRQLVQVLAHEIMNSLTPIASLSESARELLQDMAAGSGLAADARDDMSTALDAIARRAAHLIRFVDSYRSVSRWPEPQPQVLSLTELFAHFERLITPAWAAVGGTVTVSVEPASLQMRTDPAQLEQILINLAKNALESCADRAGAHLELRAALVRGGRLSISLADNGPGVPEGLETRIFTPFFTTREQGSGIGLTVARNLVHGLGGTLRHAKRPGGGACFILRF